MNQSYNRPIIGITMGDPLGIGPEILVKALNTKEVYSICRPLVLGDKTCIHHAMAVVNADLTIHPVMKPEQGCYQSGTIDLMEISHLDMDCYKLFGPTAQTGAAMEAYILKGIDLALKKEIAGIVTCPITKTAMKLAGSEFHGHTELLAFRTKTKDFLMMLAGEKLKVVLVTIHIPLSDVPGQLSIKKILKTIRLTHNDLKHRFNLPVPRIGVAGLNPHAGEDDMFGNEETALIKPAVEQARELGMTVTGPLPPDTIFYKAYKGEFDAVICMYHDQGLIPFKLLHFEDGVNTTLGLPIIRTSVDHGTAYDIAGKGIASEKSLVQAIKMAVTQASNLKVES